MGRRVLLLLLLLLLLKVSAQKRTRQRVHPVELLLLPVGGVYQDAERPGRRHLNPPAPLAPGPRTGHRPGDEKRQGQRHAHSQLFCGILRSKQRRTPVAVQPISAKALVLMQQAESPSR